MSNQEETAPQAPTRLAVEAAERHGTLSALEAYSSGRIAYPNPLINRTLPRLLDDDDSEVAEEIRADRDDLTFDGGLWEAYCRGARQVIEPYPA